MGSEGAAPAEARRDIPVGAGPVDAGPVDTDPASAGPVDAAPVDTGPVGSRRAAGLVAAGILLSRMAGLVREVVTAPLLGTGVAADAFRAALRIPNVLQNLLGEGVLSASFTPVYARLLGDRDEAEAGRVAGAVAGALAAVAGGLVVVGVVFAEPIASVLTPGFTGATYDLTVTLVRIMTPGIGFLVLSAWCLGVLNSHRRFFLSYVAPVLWNAAQIAAVTVVALAGAGTTGVAEALAWGVLVGGVAQFAVQVPAVLRATDGPGGGGRPRLSLDVGRPAVRAVARRFGPAVLGRGVVQLAGYVDLMLASFLAAGAVAALGYAQILYLLPISLFGMSVAAAELPELSRLADDGPGRLALRRRLEDGLARVAFYVAPVTAVYLAAGDLVVAVLFERGRFEPADTRLVWFVLGAYALGLLAATTSRLLQSTLYAGGDTRTPALIAVARVVVAAVVGVTLMFQLDRVVIVGPDLSLVETLPAAFEPLPEGFRRFADGPLHLGAVGLAAASALGAWLELALLGRAVRARVGAGSLGVGGAWRGRTLAAAAAAGLVAAGLRAVAVGVGLPALVAAPLVLGSAGLVYLGAARGLGLPETKLLTERISRRLP